MYLQEAVDNRKSSFSSSCRFKKKKKTEGRRMTKKGEEEAEIIGKHPPTGIQVVTTEGMPISRISQKATSFRKGSQSVSAPTWWGESEGSAPLHGWGNWGTRRRDYWPEASLQDLRRSGEPEASLLSDWRSNHGLPRPCDGVTASAPRLTHPPQRAARCLRFQG